MMNSGFETMTNEALVSLIQNESPSANNAYEQLFKNLRPTILGEAKMYKGKMVTYDTDDFLQEGYITIWKTTKTFKGGNYKSYFISAMRFHLCSLYEKYVLKNPICIAESEDYRGYGYTIQTLVESDKAKDYREKKNARQRRYYERKKAEKEAAAEAERIAKGLPKPEPKPQLTEEEKLEARRKRCRDYYNAHKDELNEKRRAKALEYYHAHKEESNRKRREKRAAEKAAKLETQNG